MLHRPILPICNKLLGSLGASDQALVFPHLERIELAPRDKLESPGADIKYVYFLESGFASIVGRMHSGKELEIGIIGREGMTGAAVVLGDEVSLHSVVMEVPGIAYRMPAAMLRHLIAESAELRRLLLLYVRAAEAQTSATSLVNGCSNLQERLARRLLMVHDRLGESSFEVTHEVLSSRLGVRRPGVTVALHILEGKRCIRSDRARVTIINRDGLLAEANGSYGDCEAAYQRLMGQTQQAALA